MAKAKNQKSTSSRSSSSSKKPPAGKSSAGDTGKMAGKGFPAPAALSVPTELKADEVEKVVSCVNPLIADAFALYTITKNFHWHLASSHFRDYHLLFDEQADAIFDSIDVLAERIRRIGGVLVTSHNYKQLKITTLIM